MSHLNYFEPYQSKAGHHEDQLTRAFLVVLRFSPTALMRFYDAVIHSCRDIAERNKWQIGNLVPVSQLPLDNVLFDTQRQQIQTPASQIISLLLTDDEFETDDPVVNSTRGTRYDGQIGFSQGTFLVIENKPRSYNVWREQLDPNLANLESETVELVRAPAIIQWQDVVRDLASLLDARIVSGAEAMMISDFLDFVDMHFPFLNPYDRLHQCKRSYELVDRRIKHILEEITMPGTVIRTHSSWAPVIETGSREMRMVGVVINVGNQGRVTGLTLSFYFGESMNGARDFYGRGIPFSVIQTLTQPQTGWRFEPNFHLNYMSSGMVWIGTNISNDQDYYEYWQQHAVNLQQVPKERLVQYLSDLNAKGLIDFNKNEKAEQEVDDRFIKTSRSSANICPGFGLFYSLSIDEAEDLDRQGADGKLGELIQEKIFTCMTALEQPFSFLKPETLNP